MLALDAGAGGCQGDGRGGCVAVILILCALIAEAPGHLAAGGVSAVEDQLTEGRRCHAGVQRGRCFDGRHARPRRAAGGRGGSETGLEHVADQAAVFLLG